MNEKYLFVFAIVLLLVLNYNFIDGFLEKTFLERDFVKVERVIDGDTVVVNGTSVRLLGINSPEKGEKYSNEAQEFLTKLVMNKSLKIERHGKDRYYRDLGYLFYEGKNLNLEIVKEGYANFYFPEGKEKYYEDFVRAWKNCKENLCEKSVNICASCLELDLNVGLDEIKIENKCSFSCDLSGFSVKDEGRKKYVFSDFILEKNKDVVLSPKNFSKSYVLTKSGDSVFVRDGKGKLVLFKSY